MDVNANVMHAYSAQRKVRKQIRTAKSRVRGCQCAVTDLATENGCEDLGGKGRVLSEMYDPSLPTFPTFSYSFVIPCHQ